MELDGIFLAKFAELTPDGLFTVVGGGMNKIQVDEFPAVWGFLFLLVRVRITAGEARAQHTTSVERQTPNGLTEPIGTESPMMTVPESAEIDSDDKISLSFNVGLMNLLFPEPGVYKYGFKIDGRLLGAAELLVVGQAR
jgi:hypothetical protein